VIAQAGEPFRAAIVLLRSGSDGLHLRIDLRRGMNMARRTATFAAGCFWGVEATFRQLPGVTRTTVGYTGGYAEHPTYKQVCRGTTGHAEAVEVHTTPARSHPSSRSRRSGHLTTDHSATARGGTSAASTGRRSSFTATANTLPPSLPATPSRHRRRKIVTAIVPAQRFWPAEGYQQQYLEKGGRASYAATFDAA
jgi:peptide-methionine (S)-S-oxide reductase